MTAIEREFLYLIDRARREDNQQLVQQLEGAFVKWLDQATK